MNLTTQVSALDGKMGTIKIRMAAWFLSMVALSLSIFGLLFIFVDIWRNMIPSHYCSLQWLPLECLIQYRCLCSMYQQFHQGHCYRVIAKLLINNIKKSLWQQILGRLQPTLPPQFLDMPMYIKASLSL